MPPATPTDDFERFKQLLEVPGDTAEHVLDLSPEAPADLLDRLDQALVHRAPHALVDCSDFTADSLHTLLLEAKAKLARPCDSYPRLWFRRLEVGLVVAEDPIGDIPQMAYTHAFRAAAKQIIAGPVASQRQLEGFTAVLAQIGPRIALVGALAVSLFQRRYPSLYEFYKWYGHRDRPGNRQVPETLLSELNNWAHPRGANATPNVSARDRLLIEAMLADLRHGYGRGRLAKHAWHRSVILLKHSRCRAGEDFLDRLRAVLAELALLGVKPPPLLVVADGRSRV
jgi:hypothetical protein